MRVDPVERQFVELATFAGAGNSDCRQERWAESGPNIYREWDSRFEDYGDSVVRTMWLTVYDVVGGYEAVEDDPGLLELVDDRDLVITTRWVRTADGFEWVEQTLRGDSGLVSDLMILDDAFWVTE